MGFESFTSQATETLHLKAINDTVNTQVLVRSSHEIGRLQQEAHPGDFEDGKN